MNLLHKVQWKSDDSIVSWVKETHTRRLTEMRDHHQEMFINILWAALGRQDIFYNRYTRRLVDYRPPSHQIMLVSNLLYPQLRRFVAKLARNPIWDVLPATIDQDDINIANLGKRVLTAYWFQLGMPTKFIKWLYWLGSTGNAYWKVDWDSEAGKTLRLSDEERAILRNISNKSRIPKELKLGDVFVDIVSPFGLFTEGGVELEDSEWIIETKLRSPEYIYKRWKKEIEPSSLSRTGGRMYDHQLMNIMESAIPSSETSSKVLTFSLWSKASGKYVHIAGDEVLVKEKWEEDEYPFVHCVESTVPGSEHGMSTVRQNRPNQAQYNRVRSNILEHQILMSNPKWLVPFNAQVKQGSFTSKSGEIIRYWYPFKPDQVTGRPLPAYVERVLENCKTDLREIGSANPVSMAKGEPNLRSGKAVLALQDADDLILGPVSLQVDMALSKLGRKLLKTLAQNVSEQRLARIAGDNYELEIMSFTGQDLMGPNAGQSDLDYFDVRVATYSTYPLSRVGIEERIDWLLERGVLNPMSDKEHILSMLGSGDLLSNTDPVRADRALANQRNYRLLRGEQVPIFEIDNHKVAIEELDKFFKPKMESLSPEIQENVIAYRRAHEQALVLKQVQLHRMMNGIAGPAPNQEGSPQGAATAA